MSKIKKQSQNHNLENLAASQINHYQLLTGAGFEIDYIYHGISDTDLNTTKLIHWLGKGENKGVRLMFMKDDVVGIHDLILSVIKAAKADVKNNAKVIFCD